jgi:DNA-binding MarR family transcriptional regulator
MPATTSIDEPGDTVAPPLSVAELSAWFNFLNAHTDLTRRLDAELEARHRVSLAEHTVLQQLVLGGGHLRMSELADSVLLSPSGVSRLVDRLVGDGLLERRPCEADGRAVHAAITERGRALLAQAEPTYSAALRRLFFDRYTPEEHARLAELLLRVAPACRKWQASAADLGG